MKTIFYSVAALALGLLVRTAGAEVTLTNYKDTESMTILIVGEINKEDLSAFQKALVTVKRQKKTLHLDAVQVSSIGGNPQVARDIGKLIRRNRLNTYLAPKANCSSACVDVLISGVRRMTYGSVNVHRSSMFNPDATYESTVTRLHQGNNEKRKYIQDMGLSSLLTEATLHTPFWALRELSKDEIRRWGILGTEHISEDRMFTKLARELGVTKHQVADIYVNHFEACTEREKRFEQTMIECTKDLELAKKTSPE